MSIKVIMDHDELQPIADNIKVLKGNYSDLTLKDMENSLGEVNEEVSIQADLINQIAVALEGKTAGGSADPVLQEKTVSPTTSKQNVTPDSGYDGLSKVTVNAMTTATQATPSISVSSAGLITASSTQTAGYVTAGTKSATKQLTTQAAQTITPGTSNKTISSGRYLTGTQTIKGDSNLVAANIAKGVSIFGVNGTYEGSGSGSGAALETYTVSLDTTGSSGTPEILIYTTIENGEIVVKTLCPPMAGMMSVFSPTINVIKGTNIVLGHPVQITQNNINATCTGGVKVISYAANTCGCSFKVTGDGSILLVH